MSQIQDNLPPKEVSPKEVSFGENSKQSNPPENVKMAKLKLSKTAGSSSQSSGSFNLKKSKEKDSSTYFGNMSSLVASQKSFALLKSFTTPSVPSSQTPQEAAGDALQEISKMAKGNSKIKEFMQINSDLSSSKGNMKLQKQIQQLEDESKKKFNDIQTLLRQVRLEGNKSVRMEIDNMKGQMEKMDDHFSLVFDEKIKKLMEDVQQKVDVSEASIKDGVNEFQQKHHDKLSAEMDRLAHEKFVTIVDMHAQLSKTRKELTDMAINNKKEFTEGLAVRGEEIVQAISESQKETDRTVKDLFSNCTSQIDEFNKRISELKKASEKDTTLLDTKIQKLIQHTQANITTQMDDLKKTEVEQIKSALLENEKNRQLIKNEFLNDLDSTRGTFDKKIEETTEKLREGIQVAKTETLDFTKLESQKTKDLLKDQEIRSKEALMGYESKMKEQVSEMEKGVKLDLSKKEEQWIAKFDSSAKNWSQTFDTFLETHKQQQEEFKKVVDTKTSLFETEIHNAKTDISQFKKTISDKFASTSEEIHTKLSETNSSILATNLENEAQFSSLKQEITMLSKKNDYHSENEREIDKKFEKMIDLVDNNHLDTRKVIEEQMNFALEQANKHCDEKVAILQKNLTSFASTFENKLSEMENSLFETQKDLKNKVAHQETLLKTEFSQLRHEFASHFTEGFFFFEYFFRQNSNSNFFFQTTKNIVRY